MTSDLPEFPTPSPGPLPVPGPSGTGPEAPPSSPRRRRSWLVELAIMLVAVVVATFVLRSFVIQTFSIPSGSMLPTLQIGDRIVVDKLGYQVHRGSIVVFRRPPLEDQNYADLVKRVIGLPGETISAAGGKIYIDGKLLAEPWLPKGPQSYTAPLPGDPHPQFNFPPGGVKIPPGYYFVMGDNRVNSEDSRWFGPISGSLIVGRAVAVVWPIGQIKGL